MDPIASTAVLVLVSTITPGPNNYFLLRLGARHGLLATVPAALGVTLGGLAMLGLAVGGVTAVTDRLPLLRVGIAVAGCLWLSVAALRLIGGSRRDAARAQPAPADMLSLFGFQFINPKAWTLVLAVAAAASPSAGRWIEPQLLLTFALFATIPFATLLLWAALGAVLVDHLESPQRRARFDRITGALLLVSALALPWSSVSAGATR